MSGRTCRCGRMEVKSFIESQINPLLVAFTFKHLHTTFAVPDTGLDKCGLWQTTNDGICIPNLLGIDIGLGYDVNQKSPLDETYYDNPVISIISTIPESFYTEDITYRLTASVATNLQNQIRSFFDNCYLELKISDTLRINPRQQMSSRPWSYQLVYGATIVPMTNDGNIVYEVIYAR